MKGLRISVVVDNWTAKQRLRGEHGLSFFIEKDGKSFLFDTGQSMEVFTHNASVLGINFGDLEGVFLSHGHYDHTGGLPVIAREKKELFVYAHPHIFHKKYAAGEGELRSIGLPWEKEDLVKEGVRFLCAEKPVEPAPGLMLTGEIPLVTSYEAGPKNFVTKRESRPAADMLLDDQALLIEGPQGLIVVLGCSHRGVVNTLRHAVKLTGEKIQAVIGGMHLRSSSPVVIGATAGYLQETGATLVAPLHCTGPAAVYACRSVLGERFYPAGAGTVLEFV